MACTHPSIHPPRGHKKNASGQTEIPRLCVPQSRRELMKLTAFVRSLDIYLCRTGITLEECARNHNSDQIGRVFNSMTPHPPKSGSGRSARPLNKLPSVTISQKGSISKSPLPGMVDVSCLLSPDGPCSPKFCCRTSTSFNIMYGQLLAALARDKTSKLQDPTCRTRPDIHSFSL